MTSTHDRAIAYITFSAAGPSGPENRLWGSATLDPPSRRPNPPATHDAPWKIRPRYDLARRGAVLPQNKQCPAPSGDPGNVSLSGKLTGVADVMGGFKFTGTLTDTRPGGLSVSFEATGVAVGFAGGVYDVQGTVPGFDALDSTFQISFFNAGYGGFGVSGARISRGDLGPKGAIGEISVSNGLFAPLPAGAAAMKFNGGVKRALTGNRFGC